MNNLLILNGLNGLKVAVNVHAIYAICEMEGEVQKINDSNNVFIDDHVAVFTDKNVFRISDSFDVVMKKYNDVILNDNLGL